MNPINEQDDSNPLHSGTTSLERINNILRSISLVSCGLGEVYSNLSPGECQHLKYHLIRQFFIMSIPFIEGQKEWKKRLWDIIKETKLEYIKKFNATGQKVVGYSPMALFSLDNTLDEITMDIQSRLQDAGFFMPSKNDKENLK